MRVAVCQLNSVDDVEANGSVVLDLIQRAGHAGAKLVCFPENSLYFRIHEDDDFPGLDLTEPVFDSISEICKDQDLSVHLGGNPVQSAGGIYNSSIVLDRAGGLSVPYHKAHLFDIELTGRRPVRESDYFTGGEDLSVWSIGEWKIGQSICYDLRFPELYQWGVENGALAFTAPAAFLRPTGKAHWEILLRARAIETQCYFLAAAQGGTHQGRAGGERRTWGHTMVIDPWGEILAETDEVGFVLADLEISKVHELRSQMPLANHRKSRRVIL